LGQYGRAVVVAVFAVAALAVSLAAGAATRDARTSAPSALGAPRFVDETESAGIAHTYDGGSEYAVGGGVGVLPRRPRRGGDEGRSRHAHPARWRSPGTCCAPRRAGRLGFAGKPGAEPGPPLLVRYADVPIPVAMR
jgi:hypothetical protein